MLSVALRKLAHHKARHGIAAAANEVVRSVAVCPRDTVRTITVEAEEADGSVGLDVVDLVNPAVKAEFEIVLAMNFVDRGRKLSRVLAQAVVAVGIGADVGVPGGGY